MPVIDQLDVHHLDLAMRRYHEALTEHRDYLNSLNVYPVPDGDTGTNMRLTLKEVTEALDGMTDGVTEQQQEQEEQGAPPLPLAEVCEVIGRASLNGARGNSGVILSQILRVLTSKLAAAGVADSESFAAALLAASEAAYSAVLRPVEGTILTVMRHVAAAAEQSSADGASLIEMLEDALEAGRESLERTPDLLEVLKLAGVVDAGGAGLLLMLEAFLSAADGRALPEAPVAAEAKSAGAHTHEAPQAPPHGQLPSDEASVAELRYEVMFLLESDDERVEVFKRRWGEVGDSIVVVGGDGLWNCHIHTDEIGSAIEAGVEAGRPRRIEVTDLHEQVAHIEHVAVPERTMSGVVAVAAGDGVRRMFEALGAGEVVLGGQTMNPSAAALKEAAERLLAEEVIVLPNNKNIIAVAEQVKELTDKKVEVVPAASIPEGLSAMLFFDPDDGADANRGAMSAAAETVVYGEVTRAVRDAKTPAGDIREGDFMGIGAEGVQVVASAAGEAVRGLLEKLVGPQHELVTLVAGAEASESDTAEVRSWLEANRTGVELDVHAGGQPLYHYYIGVE